MTDLAPNDSNAPPYSVSELAFALKRTLEDRYGFVRLRGELSKVTHHSNGHVYLTIKDDKAAIDGVVWKGNVRQLQIRPEHGLEVEQCARQQGGQRKVVPGLLLDVGLPDRMREIKHG